VIWLAASGESLSLVHIVLLQLGGVTGMAGVGGSWGLWRFRPWGRYTLVVLSWLLIPLFPIGTLIAVVTLEYLHRPAVRVLVSGAKAQDLGPRETLMLEELSAPAGPSVTPTMVVVIVALGTSILFLMAAILVPNYAGLMNRAKRAEVVSAMHTVQVTVKDFATRNNGFFPEGPDAKTADGQLTFSELLPGGEMPVNPFTGEPTNLDWSSEPGTKPTSDKAGGICVNVYGMRSEWGCESYDIVGTDEMGQVLREVLRGTSRPVGAIRVYE
jgi:hypothetical protein